MYRDDSDGFRGELGRGRAARKAPAHPRGFTLLELIISIILIGAVAAVLLNRLLDYQAAAEKANVEYTVRALKSALRLRIATLMIEGRSQETVRQAGQNPMDWLDTKPDNYHGQFANPDRSIIPPGNWYFDTADKTLIYIYKRSAYFNKEGTKIVRLQAVAVPGHAGVDGDAAIPDPGDSVELRRTDDSAR